jgi:hypothetical protein
MTISKAGPEQTVIFLHIHKTAGTTLNRIIERQYPMQQIWTLDEQHTFDDLLDLSEGQRARVRMLRGHMIFGLHEHMPSPSSYFTLLRDPIERVISFFYFIRRNPHHYHFNPITSADLGLREFLGLRLNNMMDNGQTRMLAGTEQYKYPIGACAQELLEAAKRNLHESFSVVGLTERFDETLLLLKRAYGWRNVRYVRQNVTGERPLQSDLPQATLDLVSKYNRLDLELYEYAAKLFEEQVREQGSQFPKQVRSFQAANATLARLAHLDPHGHVQRVRSAVRQRLWR